MFANSVGQWKMNKSRPFFTAPLEFMMIYESKNFGGSMLIYSSFVRPEVSTR
jgi:hypothetical protein